MLEEILIAGFGGQGVLSAGELLARGAATEQLHICFSSLYGPQQRGGTANCAIVLSTDPIDVPIPEHPSILVVMNQPSLNRFGQSVKSDGLLMYNTSMVTDPPQRKDVRCVGVDVTEEATQLGDSRVANMIMIGTLATLTSLVSIDRLAQNLEIVYPKSAQEMLDLNHSALRVGAKLAESL